MARGRRLPPARPTPHINEDEAKPRVGRPAKWIPDALVTVRARDEETADALCATLADALGSHPEILRVMFEIDARDLGDDERAELAERAKFIPIRR